MSNIEATIICIDNSDYNRNEDIIPNRFLSQIDCINVLCCNKTSMHYKNNIGILMMAGDKIKVKVSLTNDIGQLLSCIHDIKLDGTCDIIRSLLIAQLALKHRVDKNLEQKIILFIGSPFDVNEKQLINTGKQLKKNNISVDIISFGNTNKNRDKLMKLFESVNNNDNCRFIECPENETNLSKFVLNSFLNHNDFNIDNMQDEQLISAMQMSLEENQNLNEKNNNNNDLPTIEEIENMKDIDNELKEALILSLKEYTEKNKSDNTNKEESDNNIHYNKKEENLTLVNESYKNNFDNNNENKLEDSKEKKENESYEKVFKLDKDENIVENSKYVINENIYNNDKNISKENDLTKTDEIDKNNASLIQDTNYISDILSKINNNSNVFDKNESKENSSNNKKTETNEQSNNEEDLVKNEENKDLSNNQNK
ncbi:proteasome subunit alpha type 5, putative [Plasmodium gallinaceum]|uniref:Proteasome subunit alpha type 5, putative n=1 Tax=Plasmodium gallinaceum TaxID=5849 RepID=A0A1J1GZT5_PLAGA|nr:proteasome subunit alpha type 5, putative [Plasmodium gallinaceum]CRG98088.1 proteasome subunit alpha type 5, putative [Plasmodium gallinaceum]